MKVKDSPTKSPVKTKPLPKGLENSYDQIQKGAEKYFQDIDELKGGDFKDILTNKILLKWNTEYKNLDYYKSQKIIKNSLNNTEQPTDTNDEQNRTEPTKKTEIDKIFDNLPNNDLTKKPQQTFLT